MPSPSRRSLHSCCSDHDTPELYSDTHIKAGCLECGGDMGSHNNNNSGAGYLRSKVWWLGIILLGIGESGNFIGILELWIIEEKERTWLKTRVYTYI